MNLGAVVVGGLRAASGISFLVAPERAQLLWSERPAEDPTTRLLLRSMGYRDTLIGASLLVSGLRDSPNIGRWYLASAGADAADFVGGLSVSDELTHRDHVMGIGGAAVGIAVGLIGFAASRRTSATRPPSGGGV